MDIDLYDRLFAKKRTEPPTGSWTFTLIFAFYSSFLLVVPARQMDAFPPKEGPPPGATGFVGEFIPIAIALFLVLALLFRHNFFTGRSWGTRACRIGLTTFVFILAAKIGVTTEGNTWAYWIYASGEILVLAMLYEVYSIPLFPAKLIDKQANKDEQLALYNSYISYWWGLAQLLFTGMAIVVAVSLPLYSNTYVLTLEFLIVLLIPAIGISAVLGYILLKRKTVLEVILGNPSDVGLNYYTF